MTVIVWVTSKLDILRWDQPYTNYTTGSRLLVQLVQELKLCDHPMRFRPAEWADDCLTKGKFLYQKKKKLTTKISTFGTQKNHKYPWKDKYILNVEWLLGAACGQLTSSIRFSSKTRKELKPKFQSLALCIKSSRHVLSRGLFFLILDAVVAWMVS